MAYNFTSDWLKGTRNKVSDALLHHSCSTLSTGDDLAQYVTDSNLVPSCKTGWPIVLDMGWNKAQKLTNILRDQFCHTAVLDVLWRPQFMSYKFANFLINWGMYVTHHVVTPLPTEQCTKWKLLWSRWRNSYQLHGKAGQKTLRLLIVAARQEHAM